MSFALVIALTTVERDRLVYLLEETVPDLAVDTPLLELLKTALTPEEARSVFAELDPLAVTDPGEARRIPTHATTLMGSGRDR